MWRLTKAIIVSWLVGVVCGVGMVIVLHHDDRTPPVASATSQHATPQANGTAPAPTDEATR
jgi:hypothetical protein